MRLACRARKGPRFLRAMRCASVGVSVSGGPCWFGAPVLNLKRSTAGASARARKDLNMIGATCRLIETCGFNYVHAERSRKIISGPGNKGEIKLEIAIMVDRYLAGGEGGI